MFQKSGAIEIVGLGDFQWLEYAKAMKKLNLKRKRNAQSR